MIAQHEPFLIRAIELSHRARETGNHPFGAVLVLDDRIVLEAGNTVGVDNSPLGHAETNLVRMAVREFPREVLRRSVLYTSCEPCAMCVGAMYWGGIRSVVYAFPAAELAKLAGGDFLVPCRDLFARASEPVAVVGPLLADHARTAHEGYWSPLGSTSA
jgi:tRNA(Arg) A34 adenosine deaminase TadA